jgi:hypothetical protein
MIRSRMSETMLHEIPKGVDRLLQTKIGIVKDEKRGSQIRMTETLYWANGRLYKQIIEEWLHKDGDWRGAFRRPVRVYTHTDGCKDIDIRQFIRQRQADLTIINRKPEYLTISRVHEEILSSYFGNRRPYCKWCNQSHKIQDYIREYGWRPVDFEGKETIQMAS